MSTSSPVSPSLTQLQQDIAALSPDAQKIIFDLVQLLKNQTAISEEAKQAENSIAEWSDFIGCGEGESDLSRNYKNYLAQDLNAKYSHH